MDRHRKYYLDRSLLLAVGIVAGILVMGAGGAYVLSSISGGDSAAGGGAVAPGGVAAPSPAARPAPERSAPIAGGGVPAWAGSRSPRTHSGTSGPPATSYEVDPDFGAADLGAPTAPSGGAGGGEAVVADAGRTAGGVSSTGGASATPDLGGGSSGGAKAAGETKAWRSEARALASRSRALSRELGRRSEGDESADANASSASGRTPGEATTASGTGPATNSGPGTPSDPDQAPLGGAEWLAAAGAAYALNRLRDDESDEEDEDA